MSTIVVVQQKPLEPSNTVVLNHLQAL
jgi:hypothetical protein